MSLQSLLDSLRKSYTPLVKPSIKENSIMWMKVLAILAAIVVALSIYAALRPAIDQQILESQPSVKKAVAVIRIVLLNRLCS